MSIIIFFLAALSAQAQTDSAQFNNLSVELWPEYDRAEVLVIYRGELSAGTSLPARLTFQLPGHVDSMNAVAVQQNGALFSVDPTAIELQSQGDVTTLSFPATSRQIQLEYYDPEILTKQGQSRQLEYEFTTPYPTDSVTFQVQEPLQAEDFSLMPSPSSSFTGADGFKYNTIEMAGLAPGDTVELSATYDRNTDTPSIQLQNVTGEHAADVVSAPPAVSSTGTQTLGYWLIGGGVVLLVAAGGYWWWTTRGQSPASQRRRPTPRSGRRKKRARPAQRQKEKEKQGSSQPAKMFCYKCGTPLRSDANFCHNCGAERRRE